MFPISGPLAPGDGSARPAGNSNAPGKGDAFAAAAARLSAARALRNRTLRRIAADLKSPRSAAELKAYAAAHPEDPEALWLLAQRANSEDRLEEALVLFANCLELAPDFVAARFGLAKLLRRLHRYREALQEADRLLATDSGNALFRQFKGDVLSTIGDDAAALAIWDELVKESPERAECWLLYGHALRANGLQARAILAYRQAIACRPCFGAAWWALANLKTVRFTEADTAIMQEHLKRAELTPDDRINLLFALGKANEDRGEYARSFDNYAKANAHVRGRGEYDENLVKSRLQASKAVFTAAFFGHRGDAGCKARDPIFVVGRPRSGSTLIEQILASHPEVEGTAELPYIADLVRGFGEEAGCTGEYPYILEKISPQALEAVGVEYLQRAKLHRRLGRPFFVDKAPANYRHIGLIRLILPSAKIIDARRHPVASCLSTFKQNFSRANLSLRELGSLYRHYVELMEHFDKVLPGRIYRVIYERMVADPDEEIRRLLDYLELPFDERCLRFYETDRAVRTPSSEQVRRPVSAEAVDHWRHFEPWLSLLIGSLGAVAAVYPDVPRNLD